jgi:glycosyltransferase involved in cell wall biosynthesis
MPRPSVSVVLPAYNEEALIERSLQRVCAYLETIEDRCDWEVIVVDDGSEDRTGEIVDAFAATHSRVRALHHAINFNLGQALRFAFRNATGDYVVTLDSDLSYGPEHIGRLLDAIVATRAKIVIASPYVQGGRVTAVPKTRELLSRGANRLLSMTAKGELSTITGMARIYDAQFLEGLNLKAWDFEINTEIIYKAQLLRAHIVEIPAHLDWTDQQEVKHLRTSSIRFLRSIAAQAFTSFLFRPFMYFIVPGLLVGVFALYTLGWSAYHVVDAWLDPATGTFSQAVAAAFETSPHSFIVGGVGLLVSIQLVTLGILSAQAKRYFEELFHLGTSVYRAELGIRPRPVRTVDLRSVERIDAPEPGPAAEGVGG